MRLKKIVAVAVMVPVMFLTTACEPKPVTTKKKPDPAVCHPERYVKASYIAKVAGGTFYTCGGKNCVITTKVKIGKTWTTVKYSKSKPGEFHISKNTKWSTSGCGTIYKKRAK